MNCDPTTSDFVHQEIRRLDKLATHFMKQRLFGIEDVCQAGIDYCMTFVKSKCLTCGIMDMDFYFKKDHECRDCYRERMYKQYNLTKRFLH